MKMQTLVAGSSLVSPEGEQRTVMPVRRPSPWMPTTLVCVQTSMLGVFSISYGQKSRA